MRYDMTYRESFRVRAAGAQPCRILRLGRRWVVTVGLIAGTGFACGIQSASASTTDVGVDNVDTHQVDTPQVDPRHADAPVNARNLIAQALDLIRGVTSFSQLEMRVHRPDWQRTSALKAWTRGREDAYILFTAPVKDAGNATLKQGDKMWTFTPKLNRVVRLPYSLMSQSWAGSDFSYNDLSRSDKLLRYYDLVVSGETVRDAHRVYTIDAIPYDDAPVVWGKEQLVLRDDHVLLSQTFYDQELRPLKRMETLDIGEVGGRVIATRMRMTDLEETDHYTELHYLDAAFDIEVPDRTFTLFTLQSGASP